MKGYRSRANDNQQWAAGGGRITTDASENALGDESTRLPDAVPLSLQPSLRGNLSLRSWADRRP
jgi:hypothetical protein